MGTRSDKPTYLGRLFLDSFYERTKDIGSERQARILEVARNLARLRARKAQSKRYAYPIEEEQIHWDPNVPPRGTSTWMPPKPWPPLDQEEFDFGPRRPVDGAPAHPRPVEGITSFDGSRTPPKSWQRLCHLPAPYITLSEWDTLKLAQRKEFISLPDEKRAERIRRIQRARAER